MLAEVGEAAASLGRQVGDELAQVAHAPGRTDLIASGKGMQHYGARLLDVACSQVGVYGNSRPVSRPRSSWSPTATRYRCPSS